MTLPLDIAGSGWRLRDVYYCPLMEQKTVRRPKASRVPRALALSLWPFFAIMFAVGIPLGAVGGPDWIVVVALIPAILAYLYCVRRRLSKESVIWDSGTVEVHNAWKSYSIPWSDVSGVEMEKPWWLSLDQGKSDLYVPVVKTRSGQQIPVAVMYCEGADLDGAASKKARRAWVDKSEIQSLFAKAKSHGGDVPVERA